MEIADVSRVPGGPVRVCGADDDDAAREAELAALAATLRSEARAAQAMADAAMADGWKQPAPPHCVRPFGRWL